MFSLKVKFPLVEYYCAINKNMYLKKCTYIGIMATIRPIISCICDHLTRSSLGGLSSQFSPSSEIEKKIVEIKITHTKFINLMVIFNY